MKKTCLVLEGGAMRGIYSAGVIDALLDKNIKVDAIIGVSAGALFGINYVSNQRGRVLRYNLENVHNKNYMGFYSLLTTGNIMNEDFCFNKLVYETDPFDFETFKKSKIKFYATVTNLESGKAEYFEIKDVEKDKEYLRASGSMPLLSKIIKIDNKLFLDGGMSDSIPVKKAQELGYKNIIVVTTQPIDYRKKKYALLPFKLKYHKYKNFLDTIRNRHISYNDTVKYILDEENKNNVFVIRPTKKVKIKKIERNKEIIQEQYDLGYNDTIGKLKELNKYLNR